MGLLNKSVDDRLYHHHPPRRMIGCQMGWGKERGESTKRVCGINLLTGHARALDHPLTCSGTTATSAPFSRVPRPEL